jgi:hypothetical protein
VQKLSQKMAIRKVNKIHKIDILDQYENSTISQLVSQLREDELYRFFQTFLIYYKERIKLEHKLHKGNSESDEFVQFVTKACTKLYDSWRQEGLEIDKAFPEDIKAYVYKNCKSNVEALFERMYKLASKEEEHYQMRLVRSMLFITNCSESEWGDVLPELQFEEIIFMAEFEEGKRVRNFDNPFGREKENLGAIDRITLVCLSMGKEDLPF